MNSARKELLYFFLYTIITFVIAGFAAWFVWNSQSTNEVPLYDVMFEILPDWSDVTFPVPNVIFIAQALIVIFAIKEPKYKYICQHLFLNCTLLAVRGFTTSSTHMPNIRVYDYCKERPDNWFRALTLMITYGTCSDYMFSGHTVTSFLLFLFAYTHTSRVYVILNGLLLCGVIFSLWVLRWHYTSDILIALIVTWLTFVLYKDHEKDNETWFYFSSFTRNWKCERIGSSSEIRKERKKRGFRPMRTI